MKIKREINKHDLIKLKVFSQQRKPSTKLKRQTMKQEKIFANDVTVKELISKKYKQLIQLNIKK